MRLIKLLVVAGGAYVLGTKAGRERYDQIVDKASKLWGACPLSGDSKCKRGSDDEIVVED